MQDVSDPRESAAHTFAFQSAVDALVQEAMNRRDSGNAGYDFKVTELAGCTQELGDTERQIWEEFLNYLQTANENTFKDFRDIVAEIGKRLIEFKVQVEVGDALDQTISRAKFLEWLRGKMQPLETGIDLEFDFVEFQTECLDPLKKELNLNGQRLL